MLRFLFDRLFRRSRMDHEMNEEMQFHIAARAQVLKKTGRTQEEALRAARLEFGAIERYKEEGRSARRFHVLHILGADTRYGLRMMRKTPGFTIVAVLTLALGIGANSGMFGIVYGLLYRPLPFPDENSIASVHMHFSPQNNPRGNLSLADFADWKNGNTVFEQVAIYARSRFTLTGSGEAEQVAGAAVTADYFSILKMKPIMGRTFQAGDDSAAAPNQVVISTSLWQRRFGGASDAIGRVIEVNGSPATIIGVVREGYGFPLRNIELWQNVHLKVTRRGPFFFQGIGRLRPEATFERAQAETNLIGRNIERANPGVYTNLTMPMEPLRNYLVGNLRAALFTMLAFVMAVLLIATVNIANLLLARGSTRVREMAVRLSLGAARRRLVQQLLTESVLLSLAGAVAGWLLAFAGIRGFRAFHPADVPLANQVRLDWTVLAFTILISVTTGILFGIIPAIHSARSDLQMPLKEGGRAGSSAAGHHRMRSMLVVAEVAVSLVLLVSAGLLLRSFMLLQKVDVGVNVPPANVLTMVVTPKATRNPKNPAADSPITRAFYQRVLETLRQVPGVEYVAISDSLPPDNESDDDTFSIAGRPWSDQEFPSTTLPRISPDYFRALGVPLQRGRFFTEGDTADSQPVVIISASLARHYFPNIDPIGQKIQASQPDGNTSPYMDIIGIVGDVKYWGMQIDAKPAYYVPYTQNLSPTSFLVVRSSKPAATLAPMIEREIHALDKDAVIRRFLTIEDLMTESVAEPRFRTLLLAAFGGLALVLAAVGIYGVIAYSVTQRTQEIGIRMALGAQRSDVLAMVMRQGAFLIAIGLGIGLLCSFLAGRALSRFLYAIGPGDPLAFILGMGLLAAVGLAAAMLPALRATRIDPLVALRYE
ncbi:MAG TPA: ABC transporter permease [Candidatus Angelobacter sp.]|nr:ABC transporter permease [Candidatus Angelobacter sp.]